jgi:asparagine synthase (glutamine-hydrolysing)
MCGIAGAIGSLSPALIAAVDAASKSQRHRGPDDDGAWQSGPTGSIGAAFGFRRLAILDVSGHGHQPMHDPATGNCIVFNGEIYNFLELRQELESAGVRFVSRSDTEVVLAGYSHWGEGVLERLRGMFAFAIWDAGSRTVLMARDRLGIKPLYVTSSAAADGSQRLVFASELRSLLASGCTERKLDPVAVDSYLWHGFTVGPHTLVAGVKLMPPGTWCRIDPSAPTFTPRRYWQPPTARSAVQGPAAVETLRHELQTSIRQHLLADVPLGVFLSGGVDSSAIAAMAAKLSPAGAGSLRTFNISFDEAAYDESKHAIEVARQLGTEHKDIRLTEQAFGDGIDAALAAMDQPTFDGINSWFVSRAVRDHGMTVALAGTGGDELFGGYRSFVDVPRAARAARTTRWVPSGLRRAAAGAAARWRMGRFGEVPPQTRWGKLGDVLDGDGSLLYAYQTHYALFTADIHRRLREGRPETTWLGLPHERATELRTLVADEPPLHAVSLLEQQSFLGERLLRDTDWSSMAVSLEVRVPLLDHRVVEAAAGVDAARRFEPLGRKMLLRELALGNVTPEVFERPKSGFALPMELWCRQRLKDGVAEVLADRAACAAAGLDHGTIGRLWRSFLQQAPGMYWSRIWAVFVLLRWCQRHGLRA